MKNTFYYPVIICALVFSISCKKTLISKKEKTEETPIVVNPDEEGKSKTQNVTWEFENFMVSDDNAHIIYPGAIFDLKLKGKDFELNSLSGKYNPLSIIGYSSIWKHETLYKAIPSSDGFLKYVASLNPKNVSTTFNFSEDEFKDYNVVKHYLSNNRDVANIFKELRISSSTKITKKQGVSLFSSHIKFYVDVEITSGYELITKTEADKLNNEYNPYFIWGVGYGTNSIILAEADSDYTTLKVALKSAINGESLNNAQEQLLNSAKVMFYARGGEEKSFIKIANNLDEINSAVSELNVFKSKEIAYPICYSLYSLKDYSLFKHTINIDLIK